MATGRVPTTANSPLTAKGDLFGYSTTQARVAVGNNGETLVADSSTSTGLRYQEPKAANPVLNSAMQVWQRGTSFASDLGIYTADRWLVFRNVTSSTVTRQLTNDTTNLPNIQYCMRFQRNSGTTATSTSYISQSFETVNSIPFAGKTVTLSFYARAGANFSATNNQISAKLSTGTGTDQNVITGTYTGISTPINLTATLTTTWQRFSVTNTLSAALTELAIYFEWASVGTAGAADFIEVTGVQLEVGSVATPFKTNGATFQGELAACQRYFYRFGGLVNNEYLAIGTSVSATTAIGYASPKVTLRGTPTLSFTTASNYRVIEGTSQTTATSVNAEELSANNISFAFNASGFTIGRANRMNANNTTNGYIDISAEL
jgi:hypothetical protein